MVDGHGLVAAEIQNITNGVTDNGGAFLDCFLLTDVDTNAGVETKCAATCCNFGVAVDNANLFTKLIDENCAGV